MKYMILTYASQRDYDAMAGKVTEDSAWSAADFAAVATFMESFNSDLGHLLEMTGNRAAAREAYLLAAERTLNLAQQRYLHNQAARMTGDG